MVAYGLRHHAIVLAFLLISPASCSLPRLDHPLDNTPHIPIGQLIPHKSEEEISYCSEGRNWLKAPYTSLLFFQGRFAVGLVDNDKTHMLK